jgi:hypothetical protein
LTTTLDFMNAALDAAAMPIPLAIFFVAVLYGWQSCVLARRLVPGIDACNVQRGSFTLYHIDGFTTP